MQLARFDLSEAAEPAIEIESLRLVSPLQIQPHPRLRFVERPPIFDEVFLPALVLTLVEPAAEDVETGDPRQDSDQTGGPPPATLNFNALGLGIIGGLQVSPFAMLPARPAALSQKHAAPASPPARLRAACGARLGCA